MKVALVVAANGRVDLRANCRQESGFKFCCYQWALEWGRAHYFDRLLCTCEKSFGNTDTEQ